LADMALREAQKPNAMARAALVAPPFLL